MSAYQKRFWEKVDATGDCWEWAAGISVKGYGTFHVKAGTKHTTARAHRVAWELLVGPIPDGLTLDHLCRNKRCVNPDHLEPVTIGENVRRATAYNARKTHCRRGHPYSEANTYRPPSRPGRHCRTCEQARRKRRWSEDRK